QSEAQVGSGIVRSDQQEQVEHVSTACRRRPPDPNRAKRASCGVGHCMTGERQACGPLTKR
ncbi:MAG: hypothetical protein ACXVR2_13480, partial [Solirubrobacteraceae bacterium]